MPVLSEAAPARAAAPEPAAAEPTPFVVAAEKRKSEEYYQTKGMIFGALIEAIDLAQLSRLEARCARARRSATSSTRSSASRTS